MDCTVDKAGVPTLTLRADDPAISRIITAINHELVHSAGPVSVHHIYEVRRFGQAVIKFHVDPHPELPGLG